MSRRDLRGSMRWWKGGKALERARAGNKRGPKVIVLKTHDELWAENRARCLALRAGRKPRSER